MQLPNRHGIQIDTARSSSNNDDSDTGDNLAGSPRSYKIPGLFSGRQANDQRILG
jgi:hypothetical protein